MSASGTDKDDLLNADVGEEFVVERIVSHRFRNGRKEYLLQWKGYPEEENTWVKKRNFEFLFMNFLFSFLGTTPKFGLSRFN